MLKPTYIEWVFAGIAAGVYLVILIRGMRSITEKEKRKRGDK